MASQHPPLAELLRATNGVVCAVGAGGKKSLLYHLARTLPGKIGFTATVQMARFPPDIGAQIVAPLEGLRQQVERAAKDDRVVAFAQASNKPDRLSGLPPDMIDDLRRTCGFDIMLVKADGARMRLMKAPRAGEPVLPATTKTIVPIVSARIIGRQLTEEVAHRLDHITAITGLRRGDTIGPGHLSRLLASPAGALQSTGNAIVSPVINMADTRDIADAARLAAAAALQATDRFDRVVLTSLRDSQVVVDVVE